MASPHPSAPLSPKTDGPPQVPDPTVWDEPEERDRFTRWLPGTDGPRVGVSGFSIEGMYCAACSVAIEEALKALPGVREADVNPGTRRARVQWEEGRVRPSEMMAAVERAGYRATPVLALQAETARHEESRRALWRLFVAGFCMMQVMMYAVPTYYAAPGDMTDDIWQLLQWASWLLSIPVVLFSAGPFLQGAWRDLRAGRIGMDVPVALGIVVTFIASTGATFDPGGIFGSEVYFDSLTMFVFFLLCGRYLELRARNATAGALEALMHRLPETVERLEADGRTSTVPVRQLRAGDRVRVHPGQAFPADGRLLEGRAQVDEALLTGESRPQLRVAGDPLVAGSYNLSSPVVMLVQRTGQDTRYAQIVALMERASADRPALARLADRIAGPFLWVVLLAAVGAAAVWATIEPQRAVWVAVAVLIVTCPCALSLATPSALLSAAGALARRGILVQRLQALEALARADLFVFDKTGTLTEDRLTLVQQDVSPPWTREQVAAMVAALARASLHPVSQALRRETAQATAAPLQSVEELPGQGLQGLDAQGRCWRLGRPGYAAPLALVSPMSGTTAWLSVDGEVVARFMFEESLRPDARRAVAALREDGVEVLLLTGDRLPAARRIAEALGIEQVRAGATPEGKLQVVQAAQAAGRRVAMVGDGINDGPVLARADVSLAMGQGAALARARADFTLLSGRLGDVVAARRLAVRTLRVIGQNLAWAATYNAVSIPLAVLGYMPPWLAGLGMAASSLLVVLNAWRLTRGLEPAASLPVPVANTAPATR
ncbi:heavy metal translocating P-type ATPase [Caldimonas thermodepolymerans]|uniref:Cu2+-exporting ATPase n=1 Tax=Caldimonas thermodepolymerans TaxID=215580 RepID=A0AA46DDF8_9BURK|nr:cation-translocating P-type ATPase [Caldimonas thermodepolymerans]TCP07076.1 Cu2+-exporting ATPase [Caldimonas thermodepolymerans]UZG46678.1 cation-translocating P-type ATPase [Caldimonas thermodepolymerans]